MCLFYTQVEKQFYSEAVWNHIGTQVGNQSSLIVYVDQKGYIVSNQKLVGPTKQVL